MTSLREWTSRCVDGDVLRVGSDQFTVLARPTTTVRSEDSGMPLRTIRIECAREPTQTRVTLKFIQLGDDQPGIWSINDQIINEPCLFQQPITN